jgi:hypothetical protein
LTANGAKGDDLCDWGNAETQKVGKNYEVRGKKIIR